MAAITDAITESKLLICVALAHILVKLSSVTATWGKHILCLSVSYGNKKFQYVCLSLPLVDNCHQVLATLQHCCSKLLKVLGSFWGSVSITFSQDCAQHNLDTCQAYNTTCKMCVFKLERFAASFPPISILYSVCV